MALPLYPLAGWRHALATADASALIAALAGGVGAIGLWRGGPFAPFAAIAALGIAIIGWMAPALGWAHADWQGTLCDAALGVPVVATLAATRLGPIREPVLRALAACGASPAVVFRRVILPRMWSGIAVGAGFAFLASLIRDQLAPIADARGRAIATLPLLVAACLIGMAGFQHRRRG